MRVQPDGPAGDLPQQGLGRRDLQLLAGLAARVVRARDLDAAEAAGGELAAVPARERRADALQVADDAARLGGQPHDVGLAAAEVATLDGVGDEPAHGVAVDLARPRGVDAALRGDAMRPPGRVVEGEALDPVAQLSQRGGRAGPGEAGAHDDDGQVAAVGGADEPVLGAAALPGGERVAGGDVCVQRGVGDRPGHAMAPSCTSRGISALPSTIAHAISAPRVAQTARSRRPVAPRSCSTVRQPCQMCRAITSMDTT